MTNCIQEKRFTKLKSAQQPPPSLRARCCLTYLKYKCSRSRKAAARRIPIINKRNADKNCSSAKGSLLFCTSLPGLQVPVIQYRLRRSKSPGISMFFFYDRKCTEIVRNIILILTCSAFNILIPNSPYKKIYFNYFIIIWLFIVISSNFR